MVVPLEFRQAVETGFDQRLAMRPTPSLVAYATLLALAASDVEELVERELEQNPALERTEPDRCGRCGSVVLASGCAVCSSPRQGAVCGRQMPVEVLEQDPDPMAELRRDLSTILDRVELALADYVLSSLDERGFLREGPEGIANRLRVDVALVRRIVGAIRAVGPDGICAADVPE